MGVQGQRLATPSAVRAMLEQYGLRVKKGLGQNFLVDRNIIEKIVTAADIQADDVVLEIGPGLGTLTQVLGERAGRVVAIEIDAKLVAVLTKVLAPYPHIDLVRGDALAADLPDLVRSQLVAGNSLKVVANLPYYITSPLLIKILEAEWPLVSAVVMVQKEVAGRIVARPGGKEYGSLTIAVARHAHAEIVATVPRTVFYPQPDVDSALVRLSMRAAPVVPAEVAVRFAAMVRAAFGQRRKTLRRALQGKGMWTAAEVQAALTKIGMDGTRRGETLHLQEFVDLARELPLPGTDPGKKRRD